MSGVRHMGVLAVAVLVSAALVAVLVPACLSPGCGQMIAGHGIGGALAGLLGCGEMLFPQDADPGLIVQLLVFMFLAVVTVASVPGLRPLHVVKSSIRQIDTAHDPPDDTLWGRLLI